MSQFEIFNQSKANLIWKHFQTICSIPHPSKHEDALRENIKNWAKDHHLEVKQDQIGNIVILKKATSGYENVPTIILQAHIDMVPQKNNDTVHDFTKDPIQLQIDGEWLKAKGTTLGADNGIGVASALAILESKNIQHGPLEILLTIDEEAGMTGASNIDPKIISGHYLINLDTEDIDEICIGCAGGMDAELKKDFELKPTSSESISFKINVKGLKGGHSGVDIHHGRGNSIKILNQFLLGFFKIQKFELQNFQGGNLRNAIPRESSAEIIIPKNAQSQLEAYMKSFNEVIQKKWILKEPLLKIETSSCTKADLSLSSAQTEEVLRLILSIPHGPLAMHPEIKELVETSNNLAIVKLLTNGPTAELQIQCFFRSSLDHSIDEVADTLQSLAMAFKSKLRFFGKYSGWQPVLNSKILNLVQNCHQGIRKESPHLRAIHAGLECGYFTQHFPQMEMVSIGPTICFPHSPDEKCHIPSVEVYWEILVECLKESKKLI